MKDKLPIVIHDDILSKIYTYYKDKKINDTALAYGIYTFLYKTARIQNNIRVYATDKFIKDGTGIGANKLKQIKRDLRALELIKTVRPRDKNGHYTKEFYIEVKYIWKPESMEKLFYQGGDDTARYKIARELLLCNFDEFEEIKAQREYEFNISLNGEEQEVYTENFYFENDLLKCNAFLSNSDSAIDYTVPENQVGDIVIDLANSYKFNFTAIDRVLQMKKA